ncbi:MAG: hypothetical protein SW833_09040 [Cyanobacteriota bacterium]|nr:hypothetical protein [Cyanobacteriota bacterium]
MRKPAKLVPWFAALGIAWSLGYAYNIYGGGLISWLRAMYQTKRVLAAKIEAPRRLLIAGGSGAHYTVNSQLIEEKLGIPVMNFALDGNLGLNIISPLIAEQVRPGDIVLLMPEYLMLMDDDGIGDRTVEFGMAIGRPGLGGVPLREIAQDTWLLGVPSLRNLTKSAVDLATKGQIEEYYSDPVTPRGDPTRTWQRQSKWFKLKIGKPITKHAIARIKQFREEVEAKGGHLVLSASIIYGAADDPKTMKNVKKTVEELSKIAPTIAVDPQTLNVWTDSSKFADTHYHLQPEARITRSKQIIQDLKPLLEDSK